MAAPVSNAVVTSPTSLNATAIMDKENPAPVVGKTILVHQPQPQQAVPHTPPRARKARRYHALPLSDLEDTDGSDNESNMSDRRSLVIKDSPKMCAEIAPGLVQPLQGTNPKMIETLVLDTRSLTPSNKALRPATPPSRRNTPPFAPSALSKQSQLPQAQAAPVAESNPSVPKQQQSALRVRSNPELLHQTATIDSDTDSDVDGEDEDDKERCKGIRRPHKLFDRSGSGELRITVSGSLVRRPRYKFDRGVKLTVDTSDKTLGRPPIVN